MTFKYLLTLLGIALIAIGLIERGWVLLAVWLGCDFIVLGVAHACGCHRVFGKRADGTLPPWSWLVFLPLLVCTTVVWHAVRLFSREPAYSMVTEHVFVGRRLLPSELDPSYDNYVDLAAEFSEAATARRSPSYYSFPILDGAAPTPEALRQAVANLRRGRTYIHCAQGHGRTGLFALALLLRSGAAPTVEDGLQILLRVRPGIRLNRTQQRCIQLYARSAFAEDARNE